jgi:hypothetical protein
LTYRKECIYYNTNNWTEVLKYQQQEHKKWLFKGPKYIIVTENEVNKVNEFNWFRISDTTSKTIKA